MPRLRTNRGRRRQENALVLFASHPAALMLHIGFHHQFSRLFGIAGDRAPLIA
jgi:hypothetical protein